MRIYFDFECMEIQTLSQKYQLYFRNFILNIENLNFISLINLFSFEKLFLPTQTESFKAKLLVCGNDFINKKQNKN